MNESIPVLISDVSRLMRKTFDARARSIGVTRPQWQVLSMLKRNEGINQGGLADLLDVESITLCRMIDRLQDAGLVERKPDPADRRAWRLYLTPKANGLVDDLRPLAEEMVVDMLDDLSPAERLLFADMLSRARLSLARRSEPKAVVNG